MKGKCITVYCAARIARRTPPLSVHQYAKRRTRGSGITRLTRRHHRRVEDMQVPSSHLTKLFLFSEHTEEGELCKEMSDSKKGTKICNVTALLSGDFFFNQRAPSECPRAAAAAACSFAELCAQTCKNLLAY